MIHHWLEVALRELGVAEIAGRQSNPRIDTYLSTVSVHTGDETPWCSAFVNWVLGQAGFAGTGKAAARSFLQWGKPVLPDLGAITVLWRGSPDGWQGHVGFLLDRSDTEVFLLGGNQNDRVSIAAYPLTRVLAYRWPA